MINMQKTLLAAAALCTLFVNCNNASTDKTAETDSVSPVKKKEPISQPLIENIYTADPSAHVFNGRIYIYPSHDTATGTPENDNGDHFNMMDYHILSMDSVGGTVTDHGIGFERRLIAPPIRT